MGYFMKAKTAKKVYFDFIQGELEFSLEKLVKQYEIDWKANLEFEQYLGEEDKQKDVNIKTEKTHLGEAFFKYKQDCITMKDTVEKHFTLVIREIEAGLPQVVEEEVKDEDDEEDFFVKGSHWTCINCTMVNQMQIT